IKLEFLQRKFWAATRQDLDCFVIDNNGFILISKRSEEMGRFLGEVDGAVITQLLSMGVFSQVTMYDYQAMCKPSSHHHSAAQPLVSPISAFLTATRWLLQELVLFLLEWSVWGSWYDRGAEAKSVFHHSHKHKKQDQLQPCDTEYPVFVYQPAIKEANGIMECGPCRNASVKCDRMRSQKLRRRPDSCHAFHPEENAQDCGGASDTSASLPLLLLPVCAWGLLPQLLR
uniref:Voltage-dependent calcium channel alpha-2/delta subunit conserved region domain-containing protein n=1 Tax=Nomascus leucogenys TaxID=61853 RepID=G1QQM4_NOMLE